MTKQLRVMGLVALIMLLLSTTLFAQSGGGVDLNWSVLGNGGSSNVSGGTTTLQGTLGQTAPGRSAGGLVQVNAGFWQVSLGVSSASVTGTATLQGRSDHGVELSVNLYSVGAATPSYTFNPTSNNAGEFSLSGIVPGTYEIAVKYSSTLQTVETVTLAEGMNSQDFGELLAGDANDDNLVSLGDFLILVGSYNLQTGDTDYDDRADFNGDEQVTLADFLILVNNYNVAGENPSGAP